jgi:hypothetical protein
MDPCATSMEILSEDRGGAGDEVTGSVVTSHNGEDQVVAGSGVDRHQRAADASLAESGFEEQGPRGITGPATAQAKQQASGEGAGRSRF